MEIDRRGCKWHKALETFTWNFLDFTIFDRTSCYFVFAMSVIRYNLCEVPSEVVRSRVTIIAAGDKCKYL